MSDSSTLKIGLIGYGYWGPKLARNFAELPDVRIAAVCDRRPEHSERARGDHPGARVTPDYADLIADPAIDAVIIATSAASHFDLAVDVLAAGKPVLIEKPMVISSEQARRLIDLAALHQQILMVDHTYVYADAVRQIKTQIGEGRLGDLYYYDSVRASFGTFRPDVNVVWDLAVHDLAILDYLLGVLPNTITVTAAAHIPGQRQNTAYLTGHYTNNLIAHLHVNWLSPIKIRRTLIAGSLRSLCYDDSQPVDKVTVYDTGSVFALRPAHEIAPPIDYYAETLSLGQTETLRAVAAHFLDCIAHNKTPLTDGAAGLRVIQALEAADRSLASGGVPVEVDS
jgi:predicted dehydrogenase